MSLARTVEVLAGVPLFRGLDDRRLRLVAMTGEVLNIRRGERLWEQGDEGDAAYVVLGGTADILVPTDGGETSIAVLGTGEIIGEMAVLTGNPRSTAVAAHDDLTVLRLDGGTVHALLREFPELSLEVIKILAARLERMNAQVR